MRARDWNRLHIRSMSQKTLADDVGSGLEVQNELRVAHLAPPKPRRCPWGILAALYLVLAAELVQ